MKGLKAPVELAIRWLKNDSGYRMGSEYSTRQLATILWIRGLQVLRGIPMRIRRHRVHGTVFRGRRVVIEHLGQLSAGPGLILEDNVFINALSRHGIALGRNVTVGRGATLLCTGVIADIGEGITMGDRCAIGAGSFLSGQGGITLGSDVLLGPAVRVLSENHRFDASDSTIRGQGVDRKGVTIGDDCWIGAGVTILDGVSIGNGCVVGAGAVVTHCLDPFSVSVGIPARIIGWRSDPFAALQSLQAGREASTGSQARSPMLRETQ